MKFIKSILILGLIITVSNLGLAQGRGRGKGMGRGRGMQSSERTFVQPCYGMNNKIDLSSPVFISGKVTMVDRVRFENMDNAVHLSIKNDKGRSIIHLGPETYLKDKNIIFKIGDEFKGLAYKGEYDKKEALFAGEIEIDGKKIVLRDKNGIPAWKDSLKSSRGKGRGRGKGGRGGQGSSYRY